MNKIRKILISLAICVTIISTSIFAADSALVDGTATLETRSSAYMPTSSHRMAMGSAGLGLGGFYDSYLYNPANLQRDGLKIVLPSISLTVNNIYDLMVVAEGEENIVDIAQRIESDENAPIDLATLFIKSIPFGYGEILTLDTNVGFKTRGFGVDLAIQEKLRSYNGGGDYTTASLINETNVVATAALGFNIDFIEDILSLDIGASGAFAFKTYSIPIDANSVLNLVSQLDSGGDPGTTFLENIPFASGYAIPITAGANLNLPLGLSISAVGRNFNGNYNMVGYENLKSLVNNDEIIVAFAGENVLGDENSTTPVESDEFEVEIPWSLDVGLAFAPSTSLDGLIKAQLAFDFIDCYGLINDYINETRTPIQLKSDALASLNVGAQVRLLSLVDIRAGISQGYKSVGVGFDLLVLHLDASYYWKEYGEVLGQSSSDSLSVKFSLISK